MEKSNIEKVNLKKIQHSIQLDGKVMRYSLVMSHLNETRRRAISFRTYIKTHFRGILILISSFFFLMQALLQSSFHRIVHYYDQYLHYYFLFFKLIRDNPKINLKEQ